MERNTHLEFIGEKNNPEIMKKILQIFLCLFLFQVANSQEANRNEVHQKFRRLAYLRGQYEGYNKLYEKNQQSVNLKTKRDSISRLYVCLIELIKQKPKLYLKQINWAITNNRLDSNIRRFPYNHFSGIMSTDPRPNMVTELDLYKIIRYSLFEQNFDKLPDLSTIPFYDKRKLVPVSHKN